MLLVSSILFTSLVTTSANASSCPTLYQSPLKKLNSDEYYDFCQHLTGKVVLVVNTASQCGFTPQFKQLEELYKTYKDSGLVVIGFPSNDFKQDRGSDQQTANICYSNYGVTFPMMTKTSVKGSKANPLYKLLISQSGKSVGWNFQKYLLNKQGQVVGVFPSSLSPTSNEMVAAIKQQLKM
ncbi:glutathione peroxidase [Photobacterium angustum]|nr:glutathione peroxidase [Photobacterium angustum]KJG07948.1 glutathione peroxidase [Photobacterium angustum]